MGLAEIYQLALELAELGKNLGVDTGNINVITLREFNLKAGDFNITAAYDHSRYIEKVNGLSTEFEEYAKMGGKFSESTMKEIKEPRYTSKIYLKVSSKHKIKINDKQTVEKISNFAQKREMQMGFEKDEELGLYARLFKDNVINASLHHNYYLVISCLELLRDIGSEIYGMREKKILFGFLSLSP